jgi:hypothetical protein
LKETAAKIEEGNPESLFWPSQGTFRYTSHYFTLKDRTHFREEVGTVPSRRHVPILQADVCRSMLQVHGTQPVMWRTALSNTGRALEGKLMHMNPLITWLQTLACCSEGRT